jgi:AraC-like DNA-binding protein
MMKHLKSKILKKYIIYNFILILIPLSILTVIFYINLRNQLVKEVNHLQQYAMEQIQDTIERRINNFRIISTRLSHSEFVSPYKIHSIGLSRMDAVNHIKTYQYFNDDFEELMIYYKDLSLVISNKGENPLSVMLESTYRAEGNWDNPQFHEFIEKTLTMQFSPAGCWLRHITSNKRYFVISMPQPYYSSNPYGTLVGLIDYDQINKMIASLTGNLEGTALILNENNEVLFSSHNQYQLTDQQIAVIQNNLLASHHEQSLNGQTVSIIDLESALTQWHYMMAIPKEQFQRSFFTNRWTLLTTTIAIILAGIFLGILIAFRNYIPIHRIKSYISMPSESDQDNEIESIGRAVQDITSSNAVLMRQVDRSRVFMVSNLVSFMVSGAQDIKDDEFVDQLRSAGIALSDSNYCMIVLMFPRPLRTSEIDELFHDIHNESNGKAFSFHLAIKNMLAVFLLLDKVDSLLQDYVAELAVLVNRITACSPRIGVGNICLNIERLNQSLMEAIAAAEATDTDDEQIAYFSQLKTWQEKGKYWYPAQSQLRLLQAIRHGNRQIAEQAVQELTNDMLAKRSQVDAQTLTFFTSCNTARILQLADELGMTFDEYETSKFIHFATLEEYLAMMSQLCRSMLKHVDQQKRSLLYKQHEQLKAYIDANFSDNNLCLSLLAEKYGMTPSGLSRFFRDNEGINFIDYLTNLRINAACELLTNTDMTVSDIVKQVGYLDLPNFTRKFTQMIGVSPGKYRSSRTK